LVGRIEDRIEHGEPAIDRMIPANWGDEKIARPGGGDIGDPDRLVLLALLLLEGCLEELDWRRIAEWLNPEAAGGIDMPARGIARRPARYRVAFNHGSLLDSEVAT
jgi:hypothetical protein